jgi:hypothetical protein
MILETNDFRLDVEGKLLNRIVKGEDFCCLSGWVIFRKPCINQVMIHAFWQFYRYETNITTLFRLWIAQ